MAMVVDWFSNQSLTFLTFILCCAVLCCRNPSISHPMSSITKCSFLSLQKKLSPFVVLIILCHPETKCVIFPPGGHNGIRHTFKRPTTTTSTKWRGRELSLRPLYPGLQKLLVRDQIWLARDIFNELKTAINVTTNTEFDWQNIAEKKRQNITRKQSCYPDFPACRYKALYLAALHILHVEAILALLPFLVLLLLAAAFFDNTEAAGEDEQRSHHSDGD